MTERTDLAGLIEALPGAKVLVVGDLMLDRFIDGEVDRISPEAPVPVMQVKAETDMLGGAGNVARNLAALGAATHFVAVVGNDKTGKTVTALAGKLKNLHADLIVDGHRETTMKTRYVVGRQQVLRADRESGHPVVGDIEAELVRRVTRGLKSSDAVVLSDYGKGTLTPQTIGAIITAARKAKRPVLVDPKGNDYGRYRGARLVTPNRKELAEASKLPTGTATEIASAARRLATGCGIEAVLATRGPDGMTLIEGKKKPRHLPAQAHEVFDVSGAGDTVIAAIAAALAVGASLVEAARLANVAAGIVVSKAGTAVVDRDEIAAALLRQDLHAGERKIVSLDEALERVEGWRKQGLKVGFTNGCFDLLHPGHVSLLAQARAACDRLIVGLNDDASVRRLKGKGRPIQNEAARSTVLGSLATVDLVTLFADDTPERLIKAIKPDVLVKGADYSLDEVVGAKIVEGYGGKVLLAKLKDGHSTSATIKKLGR
jgi:D-beta-D-heptose 7-phosphate kinase/D-beta-D-heptose 1-phosphate adenosyltransferase